MSKQVITLSQRAAERVKEIMAQAKDPIVGVRVGVASGGCAGMSYVMEYAKKANPNDEVIEDKGVKVLIDKNLSKLKSKDLDTSSFEKIILESNLIIAIGGDGTILNCSRRYGSKGVPVLGINLGNLGFLADIDPKDITSNILRVLDGEFTKDKRFALPSSFKNIYRGKLDLGKAYYFNSYHYHNVFNYSNTYRAAIMLYVSLNIENVKQLIKKSLVKEGFIK